MAKTTTTKKPVKKPAAGAKGKSQMANLGEISKAIKKVAKDKREVAAETPAGIQDSKDAIAAVAALNKLVIAFAAERGLKASKSGTALFNKREGKLTLPTYILTNIGPEIKKGTRVSFQTGDAYDEPREGEVTKIEGKFALVLVDGTKKPTRQAIRDMQVVTPAMEAKRKNVLPTLAQGVKVVPDKEYTVKGGGSAILSAKREGRSLMWVIDVNKGKGQGWSRFGIYGSARKGTEGDVNRRFAEQQLRKITAGVKGAKKSNPY